MTELTSLLSQTDVIALVQRVASNNFFTHRTAQELDNLTQLELKAKVQNEVNVEVQKQLAV